MLAVDDTEEAMRDFMSAGGFEFPVMLDREEAARAYGIQAIPTLVIIDAQGRVVDILTGGATAEDLSAYVADLTTP